MAVQGCFSFHPLRLRRLRLAALVLLAAWQPLLAQETRPNIVLILADDLGFSDLSPYGSEINTPSLAALADNGIKFTNFHVAASNRNNGDTHHKHRANKT